jgi:hypothetical protein
MAKDSSIDPGATSSGGADEVSLNLPKKSAHEAYTFLISNALNGYKQVIFNMTSVTDPVLVPATRQCIIQILDDDIRKKLLKALAHALDYVDSRNDLDQPQQAVLRMEVCQNAVAQVYSYLDEFIGLSKVNALVSVSSVPTKEEEEAARQILASEGDIPDDSPDQGDAIPANAEKVVEMEDLGLKDDEGPEE